jgi:V8-like Glu-specific endopeptidase
LTEFIDIQHKLVAVLMHLPMMEQYAGRSTLLQGLPPAPLLRSEGFAQVDLNHIVNGLQQLGRLTAQGGTRPLIVVVDNALQYAPAGGEVAQEFEEVKRLLAEYYGGDIQAPLVTEQVDFEALVFGRQRDSRLEFSFVESAVRTARSVTRLAVPRIFDGVQQEKEVGYGTGWLIAPGVVITNHHVFDNRRKDEGEAPAPPEDFEAQAEQVKATFDYYKEPAAAPIECGGAQLLASNKQLDYAVIQLTEASKVADRAALAVMAQPPKLVRGARMNLVQHPEGGPLKYAIRNNFFVRLEAPELIRYQTDTEPGASGSPVCNDKWQVIGLHHAHVKVPKEQVPQEVIDGQPVTVTLLNEAIAIHSVLNDLPSAVTQMILDAQPHS